MKITITIRNNASGKEFDLSLDNKQKLGTTVRVLRENYPGAMDGISAHFQLQSERSRRHLSEENTYEEAHVYSGDRILVSPVE